MEYHPNSFAPRISTSASQKRHTTIGTVTKHVYASRRCFHTMPLIEIIHKYVFSVIEGCSRGFTELGNVQAFGVFSEGCIQRFEGGAECALAPAGMRPW